MEKLSFEEIREIIIQKCIEKEACGSQNTPYDEEFGKLMNSKNEADFWKIICINGSWAVSHNVISVEILEQYDANILNNHNIFIEKKECVIDESVLSINLSGTVTDNYGTAVVIERQNNRIYMKKGEFEIIYFD